MPISVAIEANTAVFQSYTSGVITAGCGWLLDHAVQAVGYDTGASEPYYKVRNSWGASWGESGFVRIGTGSGHNGNGVCGIMMKPYSVNGAAW